MLSEREDWPSPLQYWVRGKGPHSPVRLLCLVEWCCFFATMYVLLCTFYLQCHISDVSVICCCVTNCPQILSLDNSSHLFLSGTCSLLWTWQGGSAAALLCLGPQLGWLTLVWVEQLGVSRTPPLLVESRASPWYT